MVNTEEFSKRLKIIIDYYEISAAILAEKMQVQRSSISHILSGRNKPSLDFVLKILKAFPEVELYWLLNGAGEFPHEVNKISKTTTPLSIDKKVDTPASKQIAQDTKQANLDSEIERIVVFYKNGTFKNYKP